MRTKNLQAGLAVIAMLALADGMVCSGAETRAASAVPALAELAGDWMQASTLRNFPSVNNFAGGLQSTPNLTAFQHLVLPPYAQGGVVAELLMDGGPVNAQQSRWYPYQILRRVTVNGVLMESALRMPVEQSGVLTRVKLTNTSPQPRTLDLGLDAEGHVRFYPPQAWRDWGTARPNGENFTATVAADSKVLTIADKRSAAVTAYSFVQAPDELKAAGERGAVKWTITLAPGKTAEIEYAIAIGKDARTVDAQATNWAAHFDAQFDLARSTWTEWWQAAFTPGNHKFSGHIPTLVTGDAKIRRVYYEGALVPLMLCRTTYSYSPRCFVTAGPEYADTLEYFWDTAMWPDIWAMLAPVTMKEQLVKWFTLDYHRCYAVDCMSGEGAGPWYAANDWSIFRCLEAYLDVTGDTAFLQQDAHGKTILQRLDDLATYYEKIPLTRDSPLADYGGPGNLLECSPSYVEGVASLNAANVYMLRRVAQFQERAGNVARAQELRAKAEKLLPAVLALYVPGQGVWDAVNRQGTKVPIRHCFDYIMTGEALEHDLTPKIKSEMNAFVENELLTKTWMRAMSLQDPAAAQSDRPDHGPMGSYDGWPPLTMDVMCRFGAFDQAVAFLRAVAAVTREGPFAQAHEFLGPNSRGKDPIVRIANRGGQDANEVCGAAFADVIIRTFFGYNPTLFGKQLQLLEPESPRGFTGQLLHVPFHGAQYTIISDRDGVHAERE